jgi:hypothetical protein
MRRFVRANVPLSEPWHYRYVGRGLAAEIAGSGRTPRQVLWERQ